jgi:hypothetical protein
MCFDVKKNREECADVLLYGQSYDHKEVSMQARRTAIVSFLLMFVVILLPLFDAGAFPPEKLIGQETWLFTLPSNQDRAINYLKEYYGEHHLVITFFPAAFTPV